MLALDDDRTLTPLPNDPTAGLGAPAPTDDPALSIELPDGSIEIHIGGDAPAQQDDEPAESNHDENLADKIDHAQLGVIADDLILGIEQDDASRSEWLQTRADGLSLLGLKIEKPSATGGTLEGMSTIRHPLLLEAVLRFQANARSELLPTDGPVKIRDDGQEPVDTALPEALEIDANHYLTVTATEYYPDTDRMLFWVGLGGMEFKKVYRCPLRTRPVSEWVDATDLIVSNDVTDIQNAGRVTHRIRMRKATMVRMQLVGAYRDIDLPEAQPPEQNVVDQVSDEITGQSHDDTRPEDQARTLYECYCELDLPGYEHEEDGKKTGLPLPYKVTIDLESREILEIRRNWLEEDEQQLAKQVFVPFPYVRGPGFYGIGLVHILGNTANAITAAERLMLDAGMFANFPGGLIRKSEMRQNSLNIRAAPGMLVPVETAGAPISDAISPFPYKGPDPTLMALVQSIEQTGQRVGGTAEINVGEGRADAPVGTTIALIEQATKIGDAVHKRLHGAQQREFELLFDLFREDPEAFWRNNRKPAIGWDVQTLLAALDDHDLIPVADPNTSSHMQRIMTGQALFQLAQAAPTKFNTDEIADYLLSILRVPNRKRFLAPPQPAGGPPPDPKAQAALLTAQAQMQDSQTKQMQLAYQAKRDSVEDQNRDQDRQSDTQIASMKLQQAVVEHSGEMQEAQADRFHDAAVTRAKLAADQAKQQSQLAHDRQSQQTQVVHDQLAQQRQMAHDRASQQTDAMHEQVADQRGQQHNAITQAMQIVADAQAQHAQHAHEMRVVKAKPKPAKPAP